MDSSPPGNGKFQQRPPGSSWSGSAAAGGGWEQPGESQDLPHPGRAGPQSWGILFGPWIPARCDPGIHRGSLDPDTGLLGCSPPPHSLPRVQDAASGRDLGSGGDEGSRRRWKEEICRILQEIQAPLSPLLLRSWIIWGNILGFLGGWIQILLEIFWDFGGMHMDLLGGFLGSFWGMFWDPLGAAHRSFGWLPSRSSLTPGAIPPIPSEKLGKSKPRRREGNRENFPFPSPFPIPSLTTGNPWLHCWSDNGNKEYF